MLIKRLNLSNFRGLINATLDFKPGFNLIVGVNGAGKSSVLDALLVLVSRAMPTLTPADSFNLGFIASDITLDRGQTIATMDFDCHQQSFSIALSEQSATTRDAINSQTGFKQVKDIDPLTVPRRPTRLKPGDTRLEGTLRGQVSVRPEIDAVLTPQPDVDLKSKALQPLILYFSVRRAVVKVGAKKSKRQAPPYRGIFDNERGCDLKEFATWWKARETVATENSKSRYALELSAVKQAFQEILPDLTDWEIDGDQLTAIKTVTLFQRDDSDKEIQVEERRRLPLHLLSDGERSLLAIAVDIARRLATLNEGSETPLASGEGLVLIDELDLHLHPKWQRTIIESLRSAFPRLQFICTTHSPFLIQSQRLGNLIQLDKEGDEEAAAEEFHRQSIEDIVEDVQGVELPQKSKRYLDMMDAAESYYRRLHEVADEADTELLSLKKRLDELTIPFGDDAAFAALLKYERGTVAASKPETTCVMV